jgi:hypothetical protein
VSTRAPRGDAEGGKRKAERASTFPSATARPEAPESPSSVLNPQSSPASPLAGVVGDAAASRSGDDVRRRGWFWHWNSIVTQYAPLIGLKGVGLLNSYTVWTDRREESPHRGYAFPSQQSEADFYGEDRAELIVINKILVALDLIEIRKEMVLRVDEQGRRWRVPHNFYRVKDHGDGFVLGSRDVLKVVELADREQAVYRYVRHIFSSRFAPIDADNVWTGILAELQRHEVWHRLAARVAREEDRASARTRAGHAARKSSLGTPDRRDNATTTNTQNDSVNVTTDRAEQTSVAATNKGSADDVAPANNGFDAAKSTDVGPVNPAPATSVEPSNRTYHQFRLTTTTTDEEIESESSVVDHRSSEGASTDRILDTSESAPSGRAGGARPLTPMHVEAGPGGQPAPADAAGEAAAIRAFEDANGRRSTPAERQLLRGLAERFDPAACDQARPDLPTGWSWLAAAVYEAVEAGSSFVAPRRLREILGRWEREGAPCEGGQGGRGTDGQAERRANGRGYPQSSVLSPQSSSPSASPSAPLPPSVPDIPLPHGFGSRRTWDFTVSLLAGVIDRERLAELIAGTAIVGYRDGEVTLAVPDAARAERIGGEYRDLIVRKLSEAMRRPVQLAVLTIDGQTDRRTDGQNDSVLAFSSSPDDREDEEPAIPVFPVVECGLPSGQVWAAVLEEVAANGAVGRANFDAWLRTTALIGRGDDGSLVVGVPHALAQRRITARFLAPLRSAAAAIIGADLPIDVVVARDWLRLQALRPSVAADLRKAGA